LNVDPPGLPLQLLQQSALDHPPDHLTLRPVPEVLTARRRHPEVKGPAVSCLKGPGPDPPREGGLDPVFLRPTGPHLDSGLELADDLAARFRPNVLLHPEPGRLSQKGLSERQGQDPRIGERQTNPTCRRFGIHEHSHFAANRGLAPSADLQGQFMHTTPTRFLPLIVSMVALSAAAATLEAQVVPSAYRFIDRRMSVDVQAGYHPADPGSLGMGPKTGPTAGARWGVHISGPMALELGGWYMPTTRDVVDLERPEGSQAIAEADVQLAAALADIQILLGGPRTWHHLAPYFTLGAGLAYDFAGFQPEDDLLDDANKRFDFGTSILARLGGGIKFIPVQSFEVRADALLELWKVDTPVGWLALEQELGPLPQDEWVNGWNLTLGAGWRF